MLNINGSAQIGCEVDIQTETSLVINASHSIVSSQVTGILAEDTVLAEGYYSDFTALSLHTIVQGGPLQSLISLHIAPDCTMPVPVNIYGILVDTPNLESSGLNQYGLYIADQTQAANNFAIYTNQGSVRIGSLAGGGSRTVMVDDDGVLYAY